MGGVKLVPQDSVYLLLDDVGTRLCAAWPLLTLHQRTTYSPLELASALSRLAHCAEHEAAERLEFLLQSGVLLSDGTVKAEVQGYLNKLGARRLGLEGEVQPPPYNPTDDEPLDDDEDDEGWEE
jgi:hypothetical protein